MIRGRLFEGVLLNYDIYNQGLVMKYKNLNDLYDFMILSDAWIDEFKIHDKKFEMKETGEGQKGYFQVIGQDGLKVLYYWQKKLILSRQPGNTDYYLSEATRTMYLQIDEELFRFRNNRNFVNFFNPEKKELINKYLKKNRINVKKVPDELMLNLLTHINQAGN